MQKSWWVANSSILGWLSLFLSIVVLAFERLFIFFRFSSQFNLIVSFLTCVGIVFGTLGLWNNRGGKHAAGRTASLIGVLLNTVLMGSVWLTQPPTITGIVSRVFPNPFLEYERSLEIYVDLPANDLVESNLDPEKPIFVVNITSSTMIYEEVKAGQDRIVDESQLQENQHIRVEWDGSIIITDPGQIRALRIIILEE